MTLYAVSLDKQSSASIVSMKMAELSSRSGVPVPTIRYYLREGLLTPGRLTSPNQADYGEEHVRRLRLVRALLDVGGLSVAGARAVVASVEEKADNTYAQLGKVQYALTTGGPEASAEELTEVDALISGWGWQVRQDNPARATLAAALATLDRLGVNEPRELLDDYAAAVASLADREVEAVLRRVDVEEIAEVLIAFDIVGDALLSALRRLAQESAVTERIRP